MIVHRNESHANQVNEWDAKICAGLDLKSFVRTYECAIQAVENRSLITLSSVTLKVVVDRALNESIEKFALLSWATVEPERIDLSRLLEKCESYDPTEIRKALRFLLIKILNVLGNITADVLSPALHSELMLVNAETILAPSEFHALRAVKATKSNRSES